MAGSLTGPSDIPTFSFLFAVSRLYGLIPEVSSSSDNSQHPACSTEPSLLAFLYHLILGGSLFLRFSPSHQLRQTCEILLFWKLYVTHWKCRKEALA